MGVNGQLHSPAALPPRERVPALDSTLGEPQRWSGRGGKEKILITVPIYLPFGKLSDYQLFKEYPAPWSK